MLLSIITVSYNTKKFTLQTIASVLAEIKNSNRLRNNTEIIIVDNNSEDDTLQSIKAEFSHSSYIKILKNTENVGFALANNQGIENASGQYILLLNSDTIVQIGALEKLVTAFEQREHLGVVATTLVNPDGSLQRQGGNFPTLVSLTTHMLFLDDIPVIGKLLPSTQHTGKTHREITQVDWVGGTAMMVRREVFSEVGGLDKNIFMYGEDMEFCMRAKDHHWEVAIDPEAKITHFGSASSSSANAVVGELNAYLYIWSKHKPFWQMPIVRSILKTGAVLRIVTFGFIFRQKEKARPYRSFLHHMVK